MVFNLEFYIQPNYQFSHGKLRKFTSSFFFFGGGKLFEDVLKQNKGVKQQSQEWNSVSTPRKKLSPRC